MDIITRFLDCPEYMDQQGTLKCGLPAEVQDRYAVASTDGPLESVKIHCPRGHWFNGPVESLTWDKHPDVGIGHEKRIQRHDMASVPGRKR
jgi:hypothetical protein